MNTEKFTTVTYNFADGTKLVQPITKGVIYGEKGRKRTINDLHKLFAETAWDKKAISYTIDSETNDTIVIEKEIHFTKNERKVAKRDYKDFMKSNPNGFKQSLKSFQKQFVDAITHNKRIRFNIGNVILQ